MDEKKVWADLHEQDQKNLITFLDAELHLTATFCDLAEQTKNADHWATLQQKIRDALDTVHRFQNRIEDPAVARAIDDKLGDLERRVEKLTRH